MYNHELSLLKKVAVLNRAKTLLSSLSIMAGETNPWKNFWEYQTKK